MYTRLLAQNQIYIRTEYPSVISAKRSRPDWRFVNYLKLLNLVGFSGELPDRLLNVARQQK